jgi:diguanylate cyclase (GGDEF)-like protein/PAS domain S-box-containing protein
MLAVAEATSGKTSPQLGQQICDPCFVPDWSEAYRKGRVLVVSDIYTTQIAGCHRAFLEQLQIRAKVLIPIIQGDTLWGLMEAVESHAPRQWHPDEVALLEQLATQLAIAIQQATAYQQLQTELLEREQTEARLRESEQRYATLAAAAPVGIYRTDAVGNYLYVNQRWCAIAGLTPEAALGMGWRKGLHSGDRDNIAEEWHRADQESRPFQLEYRFQRLDGTVTWVFGQAVAERNANEQITGYVGTITDINDLKQAQELIIHNALHDPLTGLPNRTRLVERLELAMNRARRIENYNYAVLFLDLDRFKVINDSLGHWVGDQVLTIIAQKLKTHLRNIDLVVRLGGDEFMILLEDMTTTEDIIQVAERVSSDCQTPITVNGYEMFTSLSIGIVLGSKDYHQASDLIRDADTAMYQAKAQGRSSYKFFDAAMHAEALKRLTLETDLRKALQREEFVVYYQPIVDILSDRLIGFEALVRWQHPTRGFVSPADFIPIAEETGLIVPLDSWVFRTACQQLASWKVKFADCFPLKISINLSAQDLRKASLIEDIDQVLTETGLEGDLITLEVTESMLLEDISQTIDLLTQLKTRKIQISIDDFGTGYSSLNYLHRLPADNLKIDRSFVNQMQTENRNYQVVSTIIALSNQLGLTVVAEGIETQQQLQWLRQLGCEFGQGYLFSKPLAAHEIETHFLQSKATTALWETES